MHSRDMLSCRYCSRVFGSEDALRQHCRAKADHPYCATCDRACSTWKEYDRHVCQESESEEEEDNDDDYCESCNRTFVDKAALYQHLARSFAHNWCFICSRDFSSPRALEQHNDSRVHLARSLKCPLCPQTFKTPSAIVLHIEAGTCHSYTRHHVTKAVQRRVPTISANRRIKGPAAVTSQTTYIATELVRNGSAYECYLCHKTFGLLSALNLHLVSPAHDKDGFKCPKCERKFKLVSGLTQHIESEVCGVARFAHVFDEVQAIASRLQNFNLLSF